MISPAIMPVRSSYLTLDTLPITQRTYHNLCGGELQVSCERNQGKHTISSFKERC